MEEPCVRATGHLLYIFGLLNDISLGEEVVSYTEHKRNGASLRKFEQKSNVLVPKRTDMMDGQSRVGR